MHSNGDPELRDVMTKICLNGRRNQDVPVARDGISGERISEGQSPGPRTSPDASALGRTVDAGQSCEDVHQSRAMATGSQVGVSLDLEFRLFSKGFGLQDPA